MVRRRGREGLFLLFSLGSFFVPADGRFCFLFFREIGCSFPELSWVDVFAHPETGRDFAAKAAKYFSNRRER